MRCENLPDEGHNKLIWKRSRNRSRDKISRQSNTETWWRRTTARLLGVSFGSYRRRCRDLLIGHRGYVPLRRLGDVPLRRLSFEMHLLCRWDAQRGVVTTSPRRLIAGWSRSKWVMSQHNGLIEVDKNCLVPFLKQFKISYKSLMVIIFFINVKRIAWGDSIIHDLGLVFLKSLWFLEYIFLNLFLFFPDVFLIFHNRVTFHNTRNGSDDTAESEKKKRPFLMFIFNKFSQKLQE